MLLIIATWIGLIKKINWAVSRQKKTKAKQPDTEEAGKEGRVKRSLQEMQRG